MNKDMKNLITKLNKLSYEYYTLGKPSVSDETYDKLYDDLLKLEKETGIILSNSPTQKVGNVVLDKLQKSTHELPLLSLDKTKDINALSNFTKGKYGVLMLKMDGLTVDITYDNGELQKAETRGNGIIGEDVTENVKQFTNIPLSIPHKNKIHVVGEAIITYDTFNEINSKLPTDKQYKNPRNLVSGSVRQLDSAICKQRQVKFIAYNLFGTDIKHKDNQLKFIENQGFNIVDAMILGSIDMQYENLNKNIEYMKKLAETKLFPIDGLVMAHNDIEYGDSLGKTTHHFNHSLAFKFGDSIEIITLRNIEFQVGRTGNITPVAVFDEVELEGTTVNRASVHNLSILKELQLGIGDEISVYKANAIIPQIKDNLTRSNNIIIPTHCPVCGGLTEISVSDSGVETLICTNDNCTAKLIQKITHYCSRNAMNIEGLSEKTIEKLIDLNILKSISDIYILKKDKNKEQILKLDGFGIKSYNNLINSIEKSKQCKLENFIFGLGIENVGKSTAKNLVEFAKGNSNTSLDILNNILDMQVCDLMRMKDCGNVVACSIYNWFSNSSNREMLAYLTQQELTFIEDKPIEITSSDNPLSGKHVYPTGTFSLKKSELKVELQKLGAIVEPSYKKSLDYLITANDTSKTGKVDKAIKDGVALFTEEELLKLISHNK
jgi:DNA ligase (NAD+)